MKKVAYYAHTKTSSDGTVLPPKNWQPLEEHLRNVGGLASKFAAAFASEEWGYSVGLLHDIGKASPEFQRYLIESSEQMDPKAGTHIPRRVEHSGPGAAFAEDFIKGYGRALAYLIAGHHAGLPDWHSAETANAALSNRLETGRKLLPALGDYPEKIRKSLPLTLKAPAYIKSDKEIHLWLRMIFSSLTDADFLDTEAFMSPNASPMRKGFKGIEELSRLFFGHLENTEKSAPKTKVNSIRAEVRRYCETAAEKAPGLFSLTVPTGGGKTLSSLAFAFRHALRYEKKRIIYVIPYTSIIEQTAAILAGILGGDNVVEHHSNIEPEKETLRSRLASENWDAPLVVTTNVQFFESLYAARPGRCRKLHNIAGSVVILDEAQLLPPEMLKPCVDAMRQLVENYGVTLLFTTATQPAFKDIGAVHEIVPDPAGLYSRLKRVEYSIPSAAAPRTVSWEELAADLQKSPQVLCIVNTRADCRNLFKLMPEGTYHLSALMCGAHRSKIIAEIKLRLKEGDPVRVISTQLVEAGVDIDFPVVYRAWAGLDSVAQAAGRCNREGKLNSEGGLGKVYVFVPPSAVPPGIMRKAADAFKALSASTGFVPDAPEMYKKYFDLFYSSVNSTDSAGIMGLLTKDARELKIEFRTAAEKFRLIDDYSQPVVVRYGNSEKLISWLRAAGPGRELMRGLQRYVVNVPQKKLARMAREGGVSEVSPGVWVQEKAGYSQTTGLDIFSGMIEPQELIV